MRRNLLPREARGRPERHGRAGDVVRRAEDRRGSGGSGYRKRTPRGSTSRAPRSRSWKSAELVALLEALPELPDPAAAVAIVVGLHERGATTLPPVVRACVGDQPTRWSILWGRVLAPGLRRWSVELPDDPAAGRVIGAALGQLLDEAEAATLGELSMIARHREDGG